MTEDERKEGIRQLKALIERGEEFRKQGYDCEMMQAINYALLAKLEGKANG